MVKLAIVRLPHERYVVKRLVEFYKKSGFLAKPFVNVAMEAKKAGTGLPWSTQPEIDTLLSPLKGNIPTLTHIEAHEVKLFRKKRDGTLDQSYYVGIDEALATLSFGVDYAVLEAVIWDCRNEKSYASYFKPLVHLIYYLPIGFLLRGACFSSSYVIFTDPLMYVKPKNNPLLNLKEVKEARELLKQMFTVKL